MKLYGYITDVSFFTYEFHVPLGINRTSEVNGIRVMHLTNVDLPEINMDGRTWRRFEKYDLEKIGFAWGNNYEG